jgi:hypothetical protein
VVVEEQFHIQLALALIEEQPVVLKKPEERNL